MVVLIAISLILLMDSKKSNPGLPRQENIEVVRGEKELDLGDGIRMKLVYIPPGEFTMGSPVGERFRQPKETQHKVEITRGFYFGKFEVTI